MKATRHKICIHIVYIPLYQTRIQAELIYCERTASVCEKELTRRDLWSSVEDGDVLYLVVGDDFTGNDSCQNLSN